MGQGSAQKLAGVLAVASRTVTDRANMRSFALWLLLSVCYPVWPQTSSSTGAVGGWIIDSSQAPLGSAHVVVRNQETGLTRAGEGDALGYYRIGELPVGSYTVEVS